MMMINHENCTIEAAAGDSSLVTSTSLDTLLQNLGSASLLGHNMFMARPRGLMFDCSLLFRFTCVSDITGRVVRNRLSTVHLLGFIPSWWRVLPAESA